MSIKQAVAPQSSVRPSLLARSITLMKPLTWFAPAWAFMCGSIVSGASYWTVVDIGRTLLGMLLAGPIVCGLSQVINDYCDREVDAINEPQRLIPAGLVSTRQVFITIATLVLLSMGIALILGPTVALLTSIGMVLAVVYSANPVRAKRNGWIGNAMVAISYEGLPWLAGHLSFAPLSTNSLILAALFSLGTHGIMTINDFKSIAGDRQVGINTIPALYGPKRAAMMVVLTMALSQVLVLLVLISQQRWWAIITMSLIVIAQIPLQRTFLQHPVEDAVKYSATSSGLFVIGMLIAAIAMR